MWTSLRASCTKQRCEGKLGKINWTLRSFRLDELTDYYKNPRSLSEKEFKQLKTSLDKFGMIDKPIVNADSANTIIGGHQRKKILETLMGVAPDFEVDVRVPDRELTIDESRELNVRLNKNVAEWNTDILANNFDMGDLKEWGFEDFELGFTSPEFKSYDESVADGISVCICPNCGNEHAKKD